MEKENNEKKNLQDLDSKALNDLLRTRKSSIHDLKSEGKKTRPRDDMTGDIRPGNSPLTK